MFNVLDPLVNNSLQLLIGSTRHFMSCLLQQLGPEFNFVVFLLPQLMIYGLRDFLGFHMLIGINAVHRPGLAVSLAYELVGYARGLIK